MPANKKQALTREIMRNMDDKPKRQARRFGERLEKQREKARLKREATRDRKNEERSTSGLPPLKARKKPQRRGSDRRSEHTVRSRMHEALRAMETDTAELSRLILADQTLADRLDNTSARKDALAARDAQLHEKFVPSLPKYHAILSQLRGAIRDVAKALGRLDELDKQPRIEPLVNADEAAQGDRVVSMLDGLSYQVITRSLRPYGISVHDYRRLFGLPNEFLLWTEKVSRARSEIIAENRVWEHSGRTRHSETHDEDGPPPKRGDGE